MGFDGGVWHVRGGDEPVGEIVIDEADFPWLSGRFTPGPGYDAVRDLFARELALLERDQDEGSAHGASASTPSHRARPAPGSATTPSPGSPR